MNQSTAALLAITSMLDVGTPWGTRVRGVRYSPEEQQAHDELRKKRKEERRRKRDQRRKNR